MKCKNCNQPYEEHSQRNGACPIYNNMGIRKAFNVGKRFQAAEDNQSGKQTVTIQSNKE